MITGNMEMEFVKHVHGSPTRDGVQMRSRIVSISILSPVLNKRQLYRGHARISLSSSAVPSRLSSFRR